MPLLDSLPAAIAHWQATDATLARLATDHPPEPRIEDEADPYRALVRAIVHQQVSLAAGRTIFGRLDAATGIDAERILAAGETDIRACGVSGMKARYILDLSDRVLDGRLDMAALHDLDDAGVEKELTAVKGIGPWSAKMHMIFHMGRLDVCPWEDLGVRQSVEMHYGIPEADTTAWIKDVGRPAWAPYNSLAARVLWNARRIA